MVARKKHKCHLVDTESESEDLKDFVESSQSHCSIPLFFSFSLFLSPSCSSQFVKELRSADREEQEEVEEKMKRTAGKRGRGGKE